jgi:predicted CoA-binding protein
MEQQERVSATVMEMLRAKGKKGRVALVGASNNPEKYGNIIIKNLVSKGYEVVPINPKDATIAGLKAVPSLLNLPDRGGIVAFVVPPPVTLAVLKAITGVGFETVWLQDGSFDEEVISYASEHFKNVVHHACIMVVSNFV